MQPPAAGVARSMRNAPATFETAASRAAWSSAEANIQIAGPARARPLERRDARVGELQPLDQDRHEGPVEAVPAGVGGTVEVPGADLDDARRTHGRDIRGALLPVLGEVGHLAEALSGPQDVQKLLLLGHLHFTRGEDAEEVAFGPVLHDDGSRGQVLPLRDAQDLP